jgi:hypothetical protein
MEICYKHGSGLNIEDSITASLHLLQGRSVDGDGSLGRAVDSAGFGTGAALAIAVERNATILGVDGAVMSEEKIATDKCTSTLHALERTFFGM